MREKFIIALKVSASIGWLCILSSLPYSIYLSNIGSDTPEGLNIIDHGFHGAHSYVTIGKSYFLMAITIGGGLITGLAHFLIHLNKNEGDTSGSRQTSRMKQRKRNKKRKLMALLK